MVTLKDRFKQLNELKKVTEKQPQFVPPPAEEISSEFINDDDELVVKDVHDPNNKDLDFHENDDIPDSKAAGEGVVSNKENEDEPIEGGPSATTGLSTAEGEVASQYRIMLKMGMSTRAVEQKMRADDVGQRIIDTVSVVDEPTNEDISDIPMEEGNEGDEQVGNASGLAPGDENIAAGREGSEANVRGGENQDSNDDQSEKAGESALENESKAKISSGAAAALSPPPQQEDIEANTQSKSKSITTSTSNRNATSKAYQCFLAILCLIALGVSLYFLLPIMLNETTPSTQSSTAAPSVSAGGDPGGVVPTVSPEELSEPSQSTTLPTLYPPSKVPSQPTDGGVTPTTPTEMPSQNTQPSLDPVTPTTNPTKSPTGSPPKLPTKTPISAPTTQAPTKNPTATPSTIPTASPTTSPLTNNPTGSPTTSPKEPTSTPITPVPTMTPTATPSRIPSASPATSPPTKSPTVSPIMSPTKEPTPSPTKSPSKSPSKLPTVAPTPAPTKFPTRNPTTIRTEAPTAENVSSFVQQLEVISGAGVFENLNSPQTFALDFLRREGYGDSLVEDDRVLERYAALVFYYSTGGESSWFQCFKGHLNCGSRQWLVGSTCNWQFISCNGAGIVASFTIEFNNGLSGSLPMELSVFSELREFVLLDNRMQGSLPELFTSNDSQLRVFRLQNSGLEGTIPQGFLRTSPVESLVLSGSKIVGSIPESLYDLTDLQQLYLNDNANLTGNISPSIKKLSNLIEFRLSNTQVGGRIPDEIFELSRIEEIDLSSADFGGPISNSFVSLSDSMKRLYLHNNNLVGTVPADFGILTNLYELTLHQNLLSGNVSPTICALNLRMLTTSCEEVVCSCCTMCF